MITELEAFKATVSEDALFERALNDCIAAMMRCATVGRSIPDAIVELDKLRQDFERTDHGRPILRIRLRPR